MKKVIEEILAAMQRWSNDELRSVNAKIEYVLRDVLRKAGRSNRPNPPTITPSVDPIKDNK